MINSGKSRFISLLAFIMVFAMMICAMSISVFAVDHDHDGDGVADHTDSEHTDEKDSLKKVLSDWFKGDVGQIVGWCVAGVIAVAIVVFIYIWIPKDKKKVEKKVEKKLKAKAES